jgi:hypothetical protein
VLLEAEHNTRSDARVMLGGAEELGLQVVRLEAPGHSADQAEVDTSSEIEGKGILVLGYVAYGRFGRQALLRQSKESLPKGRDSADRN